MKNDYKESMLDNYNEDSKFEQAARSAAILAEQIKLLYQQAISAFIGTLLIATVLVVAFWSYVPKNWLLIWLTTIYILTFIRFLLVKAYFRKKPSIVESPTWGRLFILGVFLSCVLWSTGGGIFFV